MTPHWSFQGLPLAIYATISVMLGDSSAIAQVTQITPDNNPTTSLRTVITPNGTSLEITGGTPTDSTLNPAGLINLFHGFSQFDIGFGNTANFLTAPNVANIFARINSPVPSNINGTIQVSGSNANLFLMNPNGVIFGPNASLNLGGSFVATTANAIGFNGREFSLVSPVIPTDPLLAVNPNALFFNPGNQGKIESRSIRAAGREFAGRELFGLRVPEGRSLVFVGNGILLDGGNQNGTGLIALGGNIELASVATGNVGLTVDDNVIRVLPLNPDVIQNKIELIQWATVTVRGAGGGQIAVQAHTLTMDDGSILLGGISPFQTVSSSVSQAGDIDVNVQELVRLSGLATFTERTTIANSVGILGVSDIEGQGGNIRINTKQLNVTDGAQIFASTFGKSRAGNITIKAEEIYFIGDRVVPGNVKPAASQVFTRVETDAEGNGGTLNIQTGLLSITGGAALSASTLGKGTAGNIIIEKAATVLVNGFGQTGNASKIIADTQSTGDAGTLTINTRQLFVQNGGRVSAESLSSTGGKAGTLTIKNAGLVRVEDTGSALNFDTRSSQAEANAGSLEIFTDRLEVLNGGRVSARTTNFADAGRILVVAPELVQIDGVGSGLFFDSESSGDAQPDGIWIETGQLTVQNQGQVTVDGKGAGATGSLFIAAEAIRMFNEGQMSATTRTGQGGNVHIKIGSGNLIMGDVDANGKPISGGNEIRARAFGPGDGGSVIIEPLSTNSAGAVISTSILGDNDILAIAEDGSGGRADAEKVVAVIGFVPFSNRDTPRSDFTARSQFGLDGTTLLPNEQTEEALPTDFLNSDIAQGCRALKAGAGQSKFVHTGRGGIPMNPGRSLDATWVNIGLVKREHENGQSANIPANIPVKIESKLPPEPIVEAQRWIRHGDGTIELLAQAPVVLPMPSSSLDCVSSEENSN